LNFIFLYYGEDANLMGILPEEPNDIRNNNGQHFWMETMTRRFIQMATYSPRLDPVKKILLISSATLKVIR
jgi:hypothetical protein